MEPAIDAERRRYAQRQVDRLLDNAITDGVEQGKEYVPDPNDKTPKSKARWDFRRFDERVEYWLRLARPEQFTPELERARRVARQEERWAKMREAMGVIQA